MKKGITPVIAIILLLLITISMVGFAFVWFSRVAQTATESTEKQLQTELNKQNKKIAVDNLQLSTATDTGCVSLRNIGSVSIPAGEIKLYVDGAAQSGCDTLALAAGATGSCAISLNTCNTGSNKIVKVTTGGNQDQVTCSTQPEGSCAGGGGGGGEGGGGGGPPPPP
ncbi:MAG: hypothetical protein HYW27_02855 [Candidatus Aenigmarchaeota archaeon]|nr:hypothetical protein [Candidatus Aenigmarchaeota archaeon]